MKIKVFVHLVDIPGSEFIAKEILGSLISSELYKHSNIDLLCNYNEANFEYLPRELGFNIIFPKNNPDDLEFPTLSRLQEFAINNPDYYILYLHHKGATRLNNLCVADWRKLMLYFNVHQWRRCVETLDKGYDTVGVNWLTPGNNIWVKAPHYSGNFWWARADYIIKLPKFTSENTSSRFYAETWISEANPHSCSLHNSTVDHYLQRYDEINYK